MFNPSNFLGSLHYRLRGCFLVPRTGLEPARLSTLAPETSASTIPPPGLVSYLDIGQVTLRKKANRKARLVEYSGLEPLTSTLPVSRSSRMS